VWSLAFWSPRVYPTAALLCIRPGGGRTWWAHFELTRINITPTILRKKIEEFSEAGATLLNAAALLVIYRSVDFLTNLTGACEAAEPIPRNRPCGYRPPPRVAINRSDSRLTKILAWNCSPQPSGVTLRYSWSGPPP
jgi:hypothetical protein